MIFPAPEIFKKWMDYPMTVALLLVNILVFFIFFFDQTQTAFTTELLSEKNQIYTGRIYHNFIQTEKIDHHLWQWSLSQDPSSDLHMKMLGALAIKDVQFIARSQEIAISGDQVRAENWRKMIKDFSENYQSDNLYLLGVSDKANSTWSWLTYQFSHATLLHLFSNCVFLFFLGCVIEKLLGSYVLSFVYVLGGAIGAVFYLWYNPQSFVPMVGASASVSAMMSFYCLYESRKRIRYFYFLSPFEGQNGYIYLSPFLIVPLFLLSDISNIISAPTGATASVAYSAHIGGSAVGFILAIIYRWIFRVNKIHWKDDPAPIDAYEEASTSFWDDN